MDGGSYFLLCCLQPFRQYHLGQYLRRFRPDNVRAEQLSVFGVKNQLAKAIDFTECLGFAVGRKIKFAYLDFQSLVAALLLRQADTGHLRCTICAARYHAVIHLTIAGTKHPFHGDGGLHTGHVRQPWRADHVPCGINRRNPGSE